ncbi:hypothetical protein VTJ04DRAFT_6722 [Mycothermus thermophilus]|uniref:uncharacterized protein n=1 Tax=Humicola insolens TaxID=85995 RepID=UPI003742FD08
MVGVTSTKASSHQQRNIDEFLPDYLPNPTHIYLFKVPTYFMSSLRLALNKSDFKTVVYHRDHRFVSWFVCQKQRVKKSGEKQRNSMQNETGVKEREGG